jgi:pantoate--beta-alanine ligase
MRRARQQVDQVVVSLFVNPTQFGPNEDLSKYPRDEKRDAEMVSDVGVDILFAPDAEEMYKHQGVTVEVPVLTDLWEGEFRPGHFRGVATVVAKLFHIVGPCTAYFGWKDLQQCLVIRRMVRDLDFEVDLVFGETIREADGLAMSSRNAYLSPDDRLIAPKLQATLLDAASRIRAGDGVQQVLADGRAKLLSAGFAPSYFNLVDMNDLQACDVWGPEMAIIAAAKLGTTRLIDNIRLD